MGKFAIFSTELGPKLKPTLTDGLQKIFIFRKDPIVTGKYDPHAGTTVRGSVIPTFGGVVVQDFGPQIMDQRIAFSDESAIDETDKTNILSLYNLTSRELYFTDGYDCFLVQFSRPDGFIYRRNLASSYFGIPLFDYEIKFIVKKQETVI